MKKSIIIGPLILVLLFAMVLFVYSQAPGQYATTTTITTVSSTTSTTTERIVGGNCSYDKFAGTCKIISISKTAESIQQISSAGYQGFDVKFRFTPNQTLNLDPSRVQSILNTSWDLRLMNSWYPGPGFLAKYGIRTNAIFTCKLDIETQGSCTPTMIEFDTINVTDYFESAK